MARLEGVARTLGAVAPVSIRVNPDVDAGTHPYISTGLRENKFGIDIHAADRVYERAAASPHLRVTGIDCHIGSQLTELSPFLDALARVLELADRLERFGIPIHHLDLGGGLGIRYTHETPPEPADYARALDQLLEGRHYEILLEPGRAIAGNAGILLTRVELLKDNGQKRFAIVDAAMNDLVRPALYQAVQDIIPADRHERGERALYDLVGPVCETGDFIGKGPRAGPRPRRPPGRARQRRLRFHHEFQLQQPSPRPRGHGGWRQPLSGPPPRDGCVPFRRGDAHPVSHPT